MKYNPYLAVLIAACLLAFAGCDRYLDVIPKGYTLLNTVSDYDQWLNDPALSDFPTTLDLMGDLADKPDIRLPPAEAADRAYTWTPQFSTKLDEPPLLWGEHYARINKYNTVLQGIAQASRGSQQQKAALQAEALLGRAFEYLCLVNEYARPYDAATATQDPGVPFVTSNNVTQTVPPRGTVQAIYDQLIADIQTALPDLPTNNSGNRLRPDAGSAYSVLARLYLYMGDYDKAAKNAQLALNHTSAILLDFNNLPSGADDKDKLVSIRADVIYGRSVRIGLQMDSAFVHSYAPGDIRFKWFYSDFYATTSTFPFFNYSNLGTSVQEMKLILAETAARNGDATAALQPLNELRMKRFPAAAYQPRLSGNADTVLNWVLRERMFEFPAHGLRWFDMRRLDKEGRMPPVNRRDALGNVIATLPPHSLKYTLQIPVQVLQFNPGMQQNPL